jgi:hypothetical protein
VLNFRSSTPTFGSTTKLQHIRVLHYTFVKHAEGQVGTQLEDSVIHVGKSVDEFMFSCIRGMKDLARDPELTSGDRDTVHQQLARYIDSFPYFAEVMLVDTQGTVIASSSRPEVGTSLFTRFDDTRDEFEEALHSAPDFVYVSDLSEITVLNRRAIAAGKLTNVNVGVQMLAAVQDAGGHTVGVLVGDIEGPLCTICWKTSNGTHRVKGPLVCWIKGAWS